MTRILALFTAVLLSFVARGAEDVACPMAADVIDRCLYVCELTPTIVYTTTSLATVTRTVPCTSTATAYPIESAPAKEKRIVDPCTRYVGCGACPIPTVAKTTLITATSTLTKYKSCSTSTKPVSTLVPTSTKPTSTSVPTSTKPVSTLVPPSSTKSLSGTKSTVTPTAPPSVITTTTKSAPTCSYVCTVQSGSSSTVNPGDPYDEVIICRQKCPITIF